MEKNNIAVLVIVAHAVYGGDTGYGSRGKGCSERRTIGGKRMCT